MAQTYRTRIVAFVLAVLLVALAAACGGSSDSGTTAETSAPDTAAPADTSGGQTSEGSGSEAGGAPEPGVLRIAEQEAPDPFDPATLSDNRSIELAQNVYDGMTRIEESDLSVGPALADEWTVSDDGLVYTFTLREGATFQNGDPVTAEDVVYTLNRSVSPDVKNQYAFFLGPIEGSAEVGEGTAETMSGVKALDDRTVEITLTAPAGYFPSLVALWPYWLVDRKVVEEFGPEWVDPPNIVGTGAFRLVEQVVDSSYAFEANPDYFGGAPSLERVEVTIVPEPATALARYQAGEFDVIRNLSPATYRQVQGDDELKAEFHSEPQLRTTWINLRNDEAPFDDENVRLAFNQAIDREAIVTVALGGLGAPASTFLPPGLPGSVADEREPIPYDPEAARQLLADAGYPNGEGFPEVELVFGSRPDYQAVAEVVQGQLRENLGIDITLKPMPDKAYNDTLNDPERRPLMSIYSFGLDYPDPQEQHEYLAYSQPRGFANYANYSNPEFDALIDQANASTDFDERVALHEQAETILLDDAPVIPLYHPLATWLAKPYVQGFTVTPLYMTRWANVTVE